MLNDKLSVLLVDDNSLLLKAYSALFESTGYSVTTAENGVEALRSLREHVPDLIVSDLDMPVMSGFEFLSIVRRRFSSIKVVAMSGAFAESSIPAGLCADGFYPKGKKQPGDSARYAQACSQQGTVGAIQHQRIWFSVLDSEDPPRRPGKFLHPFILP